MILRSACPTPALIAWCRALHHGLSVGFGPAKVMRQQSRSGPTALRSVAARIADRLDEGESLTDSIRPEIGRFPVLFVESIAVGEQTGRLADILAELETHYENIRRVQQNLKLRLLWPACCFVVAVLVIALLMAIAGELVPGYDPVGLGLTGINGALIFLAIVILIVGALAGGLHIALNDESLKSRLLGFALRIPGLAGCVRAFSLQRFSLAFHFLSEAGMKADRTLAVALRATANREYREWEERSAKAVRKGQEITDALAACGPRLFPDDYLDAVRIAEESGRLSEVMARQARLQQEEADRKLRVLGMALGAAVYAFVALMIILTMIRLLMVIFGTASPGGDYQSSQEELRQLNRMAGLPD